MRMRWVTAAMSGEGARRYGGRWNPPGLPAVYLAESRALAALEILVHAPREMLVGWPTTAAVWGQKFAPALLDRRLAHGGWEPQFVDEPNEQQGDILFETLPGDPGAHGPYRDRARGPDVQMTLRLRPTSVIAAIGLLAGTVLLRTLRNSEP